MDTESRSESVESPPPASHATLMQWSRSARTRDGRPYVIRALRPDDREREAAFINGLSEETRYLRLLHPLKFLPQHLLDQFMDIDYRHRMAFVAIADGRRDREIIAVARYGETDQADSVEFAITTADAWQHRGIARALLPVLFEYARAQGYGQVIGYVLPENHRMRALVRSLGFRAAIDPVEHNLRVVREL